VDGEDEEAARLPIAARRFDLFSPNCHSAQTEKTLAICFLRVYCFAPKQLRGGVIDLRRNHVVDFTSDGAEANFHYGNRFKQSVAALFRSRSKLSFAEYRVSVPRL